MLDVVGVFRPEDLLELEKEDDLDALADPVTWDVSTAVVRFGGTNGVLHAEEDCLFSPVAERFAGGGVEVLAAAAASRMLESQRTNRIEAERSRN